MLATVACKGRNRTNQFRANWGSKVDIIIYIGENYEHEIYFK